MFLTGFLYDQNLPGVLFFLETFSVRRHVRRDGVPGILGRLEFHELQSHRLSLQETSEIVRGYPLVVSSRSPRISDRDSNILL